MRQGATIENEALKLRKLIFKSFPRSSVKTTEMHGSLLTAKDGSKPTRLLHDPKRTSLKRQATQKKCNKFQSANAHTLEAQRTVVENAEMRVRTTVAAEFIRER